MTVVSVHFNFVVKFHFKLLLQYLSIFAGTEQEHFASSDMQEKSVIVMLIVLSRTLHIKPYPSDLCELRTIQTLLKYLRESKYPQGRVTNLLTQIFR